MFVNIDWYNVGGGTMQPNYQTQCVSFIEIAHFCMLTFENANEIQFSLSLFIILRVNSWADKIGIDIWHLGDFITKRKDVQEVMSYCLLYF